MSESIPPEEPFELVAADQTRAKIGRFELRSELARGPSGIKFRAFDTVKNEDVTLFCPSIPIGQAWPTELHAAFALEHPNVIGVKEFGIEANRHFVVPASSQGQPLEDWLRQGKPGIRQAVSWLRDLALAVQFAHERGTYHGGIHPGVIVIEKGRARLTGFAMSDPPTTAISPEQARGGIGGPAGDQYSLGVLLYELIVGRHPYGADPRQVPAKTANYFSKPAFPREHDPAIPFGLEAVILRALEKEPADRYLSAADFAVDLQRLLNGGPVSVKIRTIAMGAPPRDCPVCGRRGMGEMPRCLYCDRDLVGLDPVPRGQKDESLDDDRPPVSALGRMAFRLVRLGLGLHILRVVCYLLSLLSVIVAVMLNSIDPESARYAILAAGFLLLPPPLLGIVGSALAAFVPRRLFARLLVLSSLLMDVGGILVAVVPGMMDATPRPDEFNPTADPATALAALVSVGMGLVAWAFFLWFLNRLAHTLDRPTAANDALGFIVRGFLYLLIPGLIVAAAAALEMAYPDMQYLIAFVAGIGLIVWFFKALAIVFEYVALLKILREAITEKISKSPHR